MSTATKTDFNFTDTEIAFASKSNAELRKAYWMFNLMNYAPLVDIGSKLGLFALRMRLPVEPLIKVTVFDHFCGGRTLLECQKTIEHLARHNTLTILDYGAEGKTTEKHFNETMRETIRALEFASQNTSVPVVSTKMSGLARNELLEKIQQKKDLTTAEKEEFTAVRKRLEAICHVAWEKKVGIFIDAEETWIQDVIDKLVENMMELYNKEQVIVYQTLQMYRHDRLSYLKDLYARAMEKNYMPGIKLVRGAYMEKERERAEDMGYPSPIQADKEATDSDYNEAVTFVTEHYETISSCNATHNQASSELQARLMIEKGIPRDHPHLNFCQLYGMSDHISFNLSAAGYNVAKYVPYGPVREVVPYLIRRAEENSSITGDISRELGLIKQEMARRKLLR